MQFLIPVAILAGAAWLWSQRDGDGNGNGEAAEDAEEDGHGDGAGDVENGDENGDQNGAPPPDPEDSLTSAQRGELATFLSGLGYPATPANPNIAYSTRVVWIVDFRKVRNAVKAGKIARVWPLGSPGKQRRVVKGLSTASLAAARWAYSSQAAGVAWKALVTQARAL